MSENYKIFMSRFIYSFENIIRANIRDMKKEAKEKFPKSKHEIDEIFIDRFGSAFEKDCVKILEENK